MSAGAASARVELDHEQVIEYGTTTPLEARTAPGATIVLLADEFPYDGAQAEVARGVTDEFGNFTFRVRPERNTRYTAVREGTSEQVVADVQVDIRKQLRFTRRTAQVTLIAPRAVLRGLVVDLWVVFYGHGRRVYDSARVRVLNATTGRATVRKPKPPKVPGSRTSYGVLICLREPRDNGYGPPPRNGRDCDFSRAV